MEVIRAATAGFCMGVSLALKKLESALERKAGGAQKDMAACGRICTLGPIIHNPQVLAGFAKMGVARLEKAEMGERGDYVLIRAHGIPRQEERILRERCAFVEDATCPKVKKAQLSIASATASGAALLLFGEAAHPEVRGLVSYASHETHIFCSMEELDRIELDSALPYVLASQTTQDREIFEKIAARLRAGLPRLVTLSTICDATRERQEEALRIAGQVDVMVVAGGRESGNTRRLASLSREAGIETFHIESVGELDRKNFRLKSRAGLTAGASTPKSQIDAVEEWLRGI